MKSTVEWPTNSSAASGRSASTLARVWYMTSTSPALALANTSLPLSPGTWFSAVKPSLSVQKRRHGSTSSTTRTGVRCCRPNVVCCCHAAKSISELCQILSAVWKPGRCVRLLSTPSATPGAGAANRSPVNSADVIRSVRK